MISNPEVLKANKEGRNVNKEAHISGIVNIDKLKRIVPELLELFAIKQAAAEQFTAAISAASEESGGKKQVIRSLVKALSDGSGPSAKDEAEEFIGLIESVGGMV